MSPWLALVAAGLGTAGLVDALKELLPRGLPRAGKTASALGLSAGLTVAFTWGTLSHAKAIPSLAVWAGAWGLARVVHGTTSALQAAKDFKRLEVTKDLAKRRR